jgi:hypothetical protein
VRIIVQKVAKTNVVSLFCVIQYIIYLEVYIESMHGPFSRGLAVKKLHAAYDRPRRAPWDIDTRVYRAVWFHKFV